MSAPPGVPRVHIHYRRPPEREDVFRQHLVLDRADVKVTLARSMSMEHPLEIGGRTALEDGSDAVWFTFPGEWHDVGRFHRADGTLTGIYANVLTPPEMSDEDGVRVWHTTDLWLDVWIPPEGAARVLDRDQLARAEERGWIAADVAVRARDEAERLVRLHAEGRWPPPVVQEWTRERALERLEGAR